MGIFSKRPALRWFAPLALLATVGATGVLATQANADPALPPKTAEQLLVDLQQAEVDGFSGTVVQQANLGLPALPSTGGEVSSELTSLLSGSHTLKVWYGGPDRARLAVLDDLGETDIFINGQEVWTWSSETNEATRRTLPERPAGAEAKPTPPASPDMPSTPQEAAEQVLEAVGPTTTVSTDASVSVAGRDAYELVLSPKDDRSLIGEVRVAVDAEKSVPLRVQTLSRTGVEVAEVGYTDVDFSTPDAESFEFKPPADAKVTEAEPPKAPSEKELSEADRKAAEQRAEQLEDDTTVVGEGWTTVVVTKVPADAATSDQLSSFTNALQPVDGAWGSGRLLAGTAFSAVLTDDGRLAVGAVEPQLLYDALAK